MPETLALDESIGFAFFFAYLGLGVVAVPAVMLAVGSGQGALIGAVIALVVVAFLLLALINASLSGIYSAALYRFATGSDAAGFDGAILKDAFRPKR